VWWGGARALGVASGPGGRARFLGVGAMPASRWVGCALRPVRCAPVLHPAAHRNADETDETDETQAVVRMCRVAVPGIDRLSDMYMSTFIIDDMSEPMVSSSAPYIDDDGDPVEAIVSLYPFGHRSAGNVSLMMSVDEAEALGRRLLKLSQAARENRYTSD
jgi:hypothetical protein